MYYFNLVSVQKKNHIEDVNSKIQTRAPNHQKYQDHHHHQRMENHHIIIIEKDKQHQHGHSFASSHYLQIISYSTSRTELECAEYHA